MQSETDFPDQSPSTPASGPLKGFLVVDLTRVLAGPYAAQLLADMGAEVVKIESLTGDENRRWPPFWDGEVSSNYGSVNRGKLGMALDMKAPGAAEILRRLTAKADVVIHNFLPDVATRLGVDYDQLSAVNPRIVLCSLSGYGELGPLRNKPGYDLMMQAFSGALGLTGYEGGPPVRIGVSFIDMSAGMTAYGSIVTALLARERTGKGAWVRTSLLEQAVSILGYHAVSWLQIGFMPRKEGCHAGNLSPYQPFACSDGLLVAGATNNRMFEKFCEVLGCRELLSDPRFATSALRVDNRAALNAVLEPIFATRTVQDWAERLDAGGVPTSPVHSIDQVLTHPQVLANDMVVEARNGAGETVKLLGVPFKFADGSGGPSRRSAPELGADTDMILRDILGYDDAAVAALRQSRVVG